MIEDIQAAAEKKKWKLKAYPLLIQTLQFSLAFNGKIHFHLYSINIFISGQKEETIAGQNGWTF